MELEEETRQTIERIKFVAAEKKKKKNRCLVIVNEAGRLGDALKWFQAHSLKFAGASVVVRAVELTAPVVLKLTESGTSASASRIEFATPIPTPAIPPFLQSIHKTLQTAADTFPAITLYAIPPLELTTTAVSLLHSDVDLVCIVGCRVLGRVEYENVEEFSPLIEEIILKEAIQPVILYK